MTATPSWLREQDLVIYAMWPEIAGGPASMASARNEQAWDEWQRAVLNRQLDADAQTCPKSAPLLKSCYVSDMGRFRDSSGKTFTPLPAAGMRYARVSIPREDGTRSHRTVHSLVYNTFVGAVPTGHSIDHLNRSALDNRLANLRVKSFRDQSLNQDRSAGLRPILARKVTDGSSTWKRFPGPMAASKQLRAVHKNKRKPCPTMDQSNISKCAKGRLKSTGGWIFKFADADEPEQLEGELWEMCVLDSVGPTRISVSSFGRVRIQANRHAARGFTPRPEDTATGHAYSGYCRVKTNGKHHYVHRLVAQAFLGAPKSQSLTVDHLDRNKSNNCLDNLSWADMKTQNSNQRKDKRKRPRAEIQELGGERWLPIDLK